MPCTAPVRGKTDLINPWEPLTDNDPCGQPIITSVGGVDVTAQNLCGPHYAMKYGLSAIPTPAAADPATVLLLHGESLSDVKGHPLTAIGSGAVSSTQSKFGGSSLYFPGVGDGISSPDSPDWAFGSGDFTVECWVYIAAPATGNQVLVGQFPGNAGQYSWLLRYSNGILQSYWSLDGTALQSYSPAWVPTANTWYHLAFVRSGNNLMLFVNGTQLGTTQAITGSLFDSNQPLTVGCNPLGGWPFSGYIDEVRISKVARWTSNFSVPTAPYT